jgi:mono/diheme cytochrome c family protein
VPVSPKEKNMSAQFEKIPHEKKPGNGKEDLFMGKVLLFILFFGALLFPKAAAAADQFDEGKNLYGEKCVICHGLSGNGEGPASAAFSPPPADFTNPKFWQKQDVDQFIANTVKNGHPPMPAFNLPPEEIKAIIDYISHAFKPPSK